MKRKPGSEIINNFEMQCAFEKPPLLDKKTDTAHQSNLFLKTYWIKNHNPCPSNQRITLSKTNFKMRKGYIYAVQRYLFHFSGDAFPQQCKNHFVKLTQILSLFQIFSTKITDLNYWSNKCNDFLHSFSNICFSHVHCIKTYIPKEQLIKPNSNIFNTPN